MLAHTLHYAGCSCYCQFRHVIALNYSDVECTPPSAHGVSTLSSRSYMLCSDTRFRTSSRRLDQVSHAGSNVQVQNECETILHVTVLCDRPSKPPLKPTHNEYTHVGYHRSLGGGLPRSRATSLLLKSPLYHVGRLHSVHKIHRT